MTTSDDMTFRFDVGEAAKRVMEEMTMNDPVTVYSPTSCRTCDMSEKWHKNHPETRHPFNDGSVPFKTTFGKRDHTDARKTADTPAETGESAPWPFDPVLRQALIDRNILTPEDLRDAETKIRAVTAQFLKGVKPDGQG